MAKTKEEILMNCDNENDKILLLKGFRKIEKKKTEMGKIIGVGIAFTLIGIFGIQFNDWFILSFIPAYLSSIWAMKLNLREIGLI